MLLCIAVLYCIFSKENWGLIDLSEFDRSGRSKESFQAC